MAIQQTNNAPVITETQRPPNIVATPSLATLSGVDYQAAKQSLEEQKTEAPATFEQALETIRSGQPLTLKMPGNNTKTFGSEYQAAADVPAFQDSLRAFVDGQAQPESAGEVQYAFKTGVPEWMTDPSSLSRAELYRKSRADIDTLLKPVLPDARVRQVFIDEMVTGDFMTDLMRRYRETEAGITSLGGYGAGAIAAAFTAFGAADRKGTLGKGGFTEEFMSRTGMISSINNRWGQWLSENSNMLQPRVKDSYNEMLHESLKKRLTEDEYNAIAFEQVGTGEPVLREFVDENTAQSLNDLSFNQLPNMVQFGVMAGENLFPFVGIFGQAKLVKGKDFVRVLKKAAKDNPELLEGPWGARSLEEVYTILRENDKIKKYHDDVVRIGLEDTRITGQRSEAKAAYDQAHSRMKTLEAEGKINTLEYKQAESDFVNNRRMYRRSMLRDEIVPLIAPGASDIVLLSTAQYYGRQWLGGMFGNDPATGEAVGVLGGAILLSPTKVVLKATGRGIKKSAGFIGETALRPMEIVNEKLPTLPLMSSMNYIFKGISEAKNAVTFKPTFVTDYENNVFIPLHGRAMNLTERGQVNRMFSFVGDLNREDQMRLAAGLQQSSEVYERVVNAFPAGTAQQKRAMELFSTSFGDMSLLPVFQGAKLDAMNNLHLSAKRGEKVMTVDAFHLNQRMEEMTNAAELALDNFETHVMANAIPSEIGSLKEIIKKNRAVIRANQERVKRGYSTIENGLKKAELALGRSLGDDLPTTYVSDINRTKVLLAEKQLGRLLTVEEERKIFDDTEKNWYNNFEARIDQIMTQRDNTAVFRQTMNRAFEDLLHAQLDFATAKADTAYGKVRIHQINKTQKGVANLDVGPAVEKMMEISGESDIVQMFGAEGVFFNGVVGKRARTVFENMVTKGLKKLDKDAMQYYEQTVIDSGILSPDELRDMLKTREGRVEFGLLLHQHVDEVSIFSDVTLEEADLLRRAFRDYGYKTTNKAVGAQYDKFQKFLDNLIKEQDEDGFELLSEARATYQDLIGDTQRQGGTFARLDKSAKGGDRVSTDINDPYRIFYSDITPGEMFDPILQPLDTLMRGQARNRNDILGQLQTSVSEMSRMFGDRVLIDPITDTVIDEKTASSEILERAISTVAFDASKPDSLKKLNTIQKALYMGVFDRWGRDVTGERRFDIKSVIPNNFQESERAALVTDNMLISVVETQADGTKKVVQKPAVVLEDIYQAENDIVDALIARQDLEKSFNEWKEGMNIDLSDMSNQAKIDLDIESETVKLLEQFSGTKNARQFYDNYITGPEDIDDLRAAFIENARRVADGPWEKAQADAAHKAFEAGIMSLVYRGLLNVGEYGPSGKVGFKEVTTEFSDMKDAQAATMKQFNNTAAMLGELDNPEVYEQIRKVLGSDGARYLKDITFILHQKSMDAIAVSGIPKGMSLESLISKAYNWRRGMVGTPFLATELGLRLLAQSNTSALLLAMTNQDAGRIMRDIIDKPELVKGRDWQRFDDYMKEFLLTEVVRSGHDNIEGMMADYSDTDPIEEETTDEKNE